MFIEFIENNKTNERTVNFRYSDEEAPYLVDSKGNIKESYRLNMLFSAAEQLNEIIRRVYSRNPEAQDNLLVEFIDVLGKWRLECATRKAISIPIHLGNTDGSENYVVAFDKGSFKIVIPTGKEVSNEESKHIVRTLMHYLECFIFMFFWSDEETPELDSSTPVWEEVRHCLLEGKRR